MKFDELLESELTKMNHAADRHPMEESAIEKFPDFLVQGITESGNLVLSNGTAVVEFSKDGNSNLYESRNIGAKATGLTMGYMAGGISGMFSIIAGFTGMIGLGSVLAIPIVTGVGVGLAGYGIVRGASSLTSALGKLASGAMGRTVSAALSRLEKIIVERDKIIKEVSDGKIGEDQAKSRIQKLTRDMVNAADNLERVIHREGGMEQLDPPERRQIEKYLDVVRKGSATGFSQ